MTAPAEFSLRPLSLGELLDQAIRLYRRNFFKFIGIIALVQIPVSILSLALTLFTFEDFYAVAADPTRVTASSDPFALFTPGYFFGLGGSILMGLISFLLVQGIAAGALTRLVSDAYLGTPGGTLDAYRRIGKRWLPLVGTLFLYVILFVIAFVWLIIPCFGWFTGPGILMVMGGMVLPLIPPVMVLEAVSGAGAIRRAWELVRRRFWWIFGFMLILYLFAWLVISGPTSLFSIALNYILPSTGLAGDNALMLTTILQSLVALVFSLLYKPLQLACMTLLYFDLRVRQEGLDLALKAEGQEKALNLSDVIAQSPTAPKTSFLTWAETGYIVLLGVGIFVLYFVLIAIVVGAALAMDAPFGGF